MRLRTLRSLRVTCATTAIGGMLGLALFGLAPLAAAAPAGPSGNPSSPATPPSTGSSTTKPPPTSKGPGPPPPSMPGESFPQPAWPPPPVDTSIALPNKPATPDAQYEKSRRCISSNVVGPVLKPQPWAQQALQIKQAHKFATGRGEKLAMIDTGVHKHPFFQNRLQPGGDYVQDGNGLQDCDGHGTEVAGVMAANTHFHGANPNIGFDGMAPQATVVSVRQTSSNFVYKNDDVERTAGNLHTLGQAIIHLVDTVDDLAAINISLTACVPVNRSVDGYYHFLQAAIHYAVNKKDVVVVVAAGNTGGSGCKGNNTNPNPSDLNMIPIPAWFGHDVMAVAAVNKNGDPAKFSVYGPWVDVAAPGTNIVTLDPAGNKIINQSVEVDTSVRASGEQGGNGSGSGGTSQVVPIQGTSFAAPYVTGLVALVREKYGWLNARQVMHRIEATAQHPAGPTGRNTKVGYGMIDPVAALTDVVPGEPGRNGEPAAPVAKPTPIPAALPTPVGEDETPTIVALAGTGTGIGLLLVTVFVVHTVRRNRRRRDHV